ncbi:MAG: Stk1 family PASTA domain-containing Ser/Thr kinase [Lachnospirales bacterium]
MVLKPGTLISGRYRIIEQLGVGGMAIVYKATDEKLDRDVTFKVLKEVYVDDEDFIMRFATEARAAAQLANHNIVNVYDVGNEGNINYIVMEYVEGFTLKDLICSKAPFTDEETVGIAVQIALGLKHAHKHNIVHRDIKPENILITNVGGEGTVKVTDFGIAQAVNSATSPTDNMGSVHYFSPEQAKGEKADARSDIYSLGIVMYEMVTGEQPFDGDTPVALAMKHLKSPLPSIKEINPQISDALIAVIKKCTAKEPRNRYQSVDTLIQDLRSVIGLSVLKEQGSVKHKDDNTSKTVMYKKKPVVDYDDEEEIKEKKREKNIIISAIIAGFVLICLLGIGVLAVNGTLSGNTVKVPDFVGLDYDNAASKAEKKGLIVEFEQVYKAEAEAGEVVEQSIEAGDRVEKGTSIILSISVGENAILVPDIVNMTKSKAEEELIKNKLSFGDVKYVPSDKPAGTILSQDPEGGDMVAVNSSVNVEVSQGDVNEEVEMPDLVNKTRDEAEEILKELGLVAKFIDGYSDSVEKDRIIDQGIEEGTIIGVGSTVTLTVSKGESNTTQAQTELVTSAPPIVDIDDTQENHEGTTNAPIPSIDNNNPVKKSVSVDVNPDFNNNSYNNDGSDVYSVKVVAKDSQGEKVIVNQKYAISDFPFSVNDEITDKTEYKVYINDNLISTQAK